MYRARFVLRTCCLVLLPLAATRGTLEWAGLEWLLESARSPAKGAGGWSLSEYFDLGLDARLFRCFGLGLDARLFFIGLATRRRLDWLGIFPILQQALCL